MENMKSTIDMTKQLNYNNRMEKTKLTPGQKVKEMRERRGLTQPQLGVMIGFKEVYAQSRMCRIERGDHGLSIKMASKIAEALGCKPSELLCID